MNSLSIEAGDVIRYAENDKSEITDINIVFKYKTRELGKVKSLWDSEPRFPNFADGWNYQIRIIYGTVKKKDGDIIIVEYEDDAGEMQTELCKISGALYKYNTSARANAASSTSQTEIFAEDDMPGSESHVLIYSRYGDMRGMVVYY